MGKTQNLKEKALSCWPVGLHGHDIRVLGLCDKDHRQGGFLRQCRFIPSQSWRQKSEILQFLLEALRLKPSMTFN
jgi:hypothetical protein